MEESAKVREEQLVVAVLNRSLKCLLKLLHVQVERLQDLPMVALCDTPRRRISLEYVVLDQVGHPCAVDMIRTRGRRLGTVLTFYHCC